MPASDVLVVFADAQRARIVRPGRGEALDVVWEGYAATPDVRGLNQAPDMNPNSQDAAPRAHGDGGAQLVRDISDEVRAVLNGRPGQRLIVVAPRAFADALEAEAGNAWSLRKGDIVYRDETELDDKGVSHVIKEHMNAHP
jgi:hypothetical protein